MKYIKCLHFVTAAVFLAGAFVAWQGTTVRAGDPTPDPHHSGAATATAPAPVSTSESNHAQHHAGTAEATANSCATPESNGTPGAGLMGNQGVMNGTPMAGMDTADAEMMGEFDLMFIDMMISHRESAVAMAQIALTRAEHEEIRQLAQDIIASQSAEIDQLRARRVAVYPDAPEMPMDQMRGIMDQMMQGMPGMEAMHEIMDMAMVTEAQILCSVPVSFDLAFIDAMIPHHQAMVAMAQVGFQQVTDSELKQLAQQTIVTQQKEIAQLQAWRAAWYEATPTS